MTRVAAAAALLAAALGVACAARQWTDDESDRIEAVVGAGGEEFPDPDAVDGVSTPRETTGATAARTALSRSRVDGGASHVSVRKAAPARIAKSKRDAVGRATDLAAIAQPPSP